MNRTMHSRCEREEVLSICANRWAQIEMQVAIAQMSIRDDARIGYQQFQQRSAVFDEARQLAGGHRDIVFDARAFHALCFRNRFSDSPEVLSLRFVLRERRV